jgi:hypothetical protein
MGCFTSDVQTENGRVISQPFKFLQTVLPWDKARGSKAGRVQLAVTRASFSARYTRPAARILAGFAIVLFIASVPRFFHRHLSGFLRAFFGELRRQMIMCAVVNCAFRGNLAYELRQKQG